MNVRADTYTKKCVCFYTSSPIRYQAIEAPFEKAPELLSEKSA